MQVAIVNYNLGNVRSVANAFEKLGESVEIVSEPELLCRADCIVLPGVGSFKEGMRNLQEYGWISVLQEEIIAHRKPFLGICLGMQLLATRSTEDGNHAGLNWIPGEVRKLQIAESSYRIPHIGWNDVSASAKSRLFLGFAEKPVFYFVHSYGFFPSDSSVIGATCDYGEQFAAVVERDNIYGTQFHPEKSQRPGLALLKKFLQSA